MEQAIKKYQRLSRRQRMTLYDLLRQLIADTTSSSQPRIGSVPQEIDQLIGERVPVDTSRLDQ